MNDALGHKRAPLSAHQLAGLAAAEADLADGPEDDSISDLQQPLDLVLDVEK
jgi:hypothetical protein